MRALLGRNDGRIADEWIVDTRVRNQIGLKFIQVDIQSTIEAQTRRDGADHLSNEAVEMLVVRSRDIQVAAADIVHSFVVNEEGAVGVLNGAVRGEYGVVRLYDRGGDARSRVDSKLEFALLAVVSRQALEKQSAKSRTCSSAERVEDQEALE